MGAPVPKFPGVKLDYVYFDGGLDEDSPPLLIPPGYCRRAQNYEIDINGGYRRIDGYERFDGQPSPSDATYATLAVSITGSYAVGNTITGATSGATAVIAAGASDHFVLTKITGTFSAGGEVINISGSPVATSSASQVTDGASTAKLHAQYRNAAADIYRADIAAVPGSGSILGVWVLEDVVYAVRNNAGGTAAEIYKSSVSGWTLVSLFYELSFTAGSGSAPAEGATITQSAVSATVKRVVLQSGTWAGGTAAGRFIISAPSGGNFMAGAFTAGVTATCSGAQTAITLTAGGRYETAVYNFGSGKRVYGCSGVQRGFEFDGTVYVPITTGMTTDTPSYVAAHKHHLFFAFAGSAQHSGIGTPYQWTILSGAAELAMGDTVTGFMPQPGSEAAGGALAIFTKDSTKILYGSASSGSDIWNLVNYSDEQGAKAYSAQRIGGQTYVMDDRGINGIATSANFGNFQSSTLSRRVQSTINSKRGLVSGSCVSRDKNQYRLFFSDKTALYLTFDGRKLRGIMPMLFADAVTCIWSGELSDGTEAIYFGSTDGMVYQMESGTSFDGDAIDANLYLAFNSQKTVRQKKQYKAAMLEVSGDGYSEFSFSYELGYASTEIEQPNAQTEALDFSPAFWDSFVWDSFVWDGISLTPEIMKMEGSAENVSLIFSSSSDYYYSHTFSGAILHYIPRRGLR